MPRLRMRQGGAGGWTPERPCRPAEPIFPGCRRRTLPPTGAQRRGRAGRSARARAVHFARVHATRDRARRGRGRGGAGGGWAGSVAAGAGGGHRRHRAARGPEGHPRDPPPGPASNPGPGFRIPLSPGPAPAVQAAGAIFARPGFAPRTDGWGPGWWGERSVAVCKDPAHA